MEGTIRSCKIQKSSEGIASDPNRSKVRKGKTIIDFLE